MFIEDQKATGAEIDRAFADAAWQFYCENGTERNGFAYICFCWGF